MEKLTITKRGHFWALLEGRKGIDAFPTKQEAYDEMRYLRFAEQKRQERERMTEVADTERLAWRRMPVDDQIDQLERIRQMYVAN
jgi:hypothetical protein